MARNEGTPASKNGYPEKEVEQNVDGNEHLQDFTTLVLRHRTLLLALKRQARPDRGSVAKKKLSCAEYSIRKRIVSWQPTSEYEARLKLEHLAGYILATGNALDPTDIDAICQSVGEYL